eukprot:6050627-Amphidinium_carterae.1
MGVSRCLQTVSCQLGKKRLLYGRMELLHTIHCMLSTRCYKSIGSHGTNAACSKPGHAIPQCALLNSFGFPACLGEILFKAGQVSAPFSALLLLLRLEIWFASLQLCTKR